VPTYAYACTACDHRFEEQQSFTDEDLTSCPQCDGRLRKLFSSVGVVFKGSGFYRTDSRTSSSSKSASRLGTLAGTGGSTSGASGTNGSSSAPTGGSGSSSAPPSGSPASS